MTTLLPLLVACSPAPGEPGARWCNGAEALCGRRYDQVAYATAHNAMSSEEEGWVAPNQRLAVPRQLELGVRALMLDTHDWQGEPYLCHGFCMIGQRVMGMKPLVEGLREIESFLRERPREVVTLILESNVGADETAAAFAGAGLLPYLHTQAPGAPWPTLGEMVAAGRRLVVFTDDPARQPAWYHFTWDYAWETPWSYQRPDEFTCQPDRGDPGRSLFILDHFLTAPLASPELAEQVNHNPLLRERVMGCREETGQLPNFVTLDFVSIGDLMAVVRELNGQPPASLRRGSLRPVPGRPRAGPGRCPGCAARYPSGRPGEPRRQPRGPGGR